MEQKISNHTRIIKAIAGSLGFHNCGISRADYLSDEAPRLSKWLEAKCHGEMTYMANYFDKRLDPRALVPGAKSVVSLLLNYYPRTMLPQVDNYKFSKYAFGKDYHRVIKKKLKHFKQLIETQIGKVEGRYFVDSAPILERVWAKRSGLGWIGKNTLLITKEAGSFFFLSELILDLNLIPDQPIKDYCGTCQKCVDACPTNALTPYQLDAQKCISYLTIELKNTIPDRFKSNMKDWIFGCDICQDVCPWNRFSLATHIQEFQPSKALMALRKKDWNRLEEIQFNTLFAGSAVKRAKFKGLKRNIVFIDSQP